MEISKKSLVAFVKETLKNSEGGWKAYERNPWAIFYRDSENFIYLWNRAFLKESVNNFLKDVSYCFLVFFKIFLEDSQEHGGFFNT